MKASHLLLLLAAALVGCSSPASRHVSLSSDDPITRLSMWLTDTPSGEASMFPNGLWVGIHLPATANTTQLVKQALAGDAEGFKILESRRVHILCQGLEGLVDPDFTAVLVDTRSGQKIVLLQFAVTDWLSRVYNVHDLPNKMLQATAAALRALAVAMRHDAVVASASALPAAVPELGR